MAVLPCIPGWLQSEIEAARHAPSISAPTRVRFDALLPLWPPALLDVTHIFGGLDYGVIYFEIWGTRLRQRRTLFCDESGYEVFAGADHRMFDKPEGAVRYMLGGLDTYHHPW